MVKWLYKRFLELLPIDQIQIHMSPSRCDAWTVMRAAYVHQFHPEGFYLASEDYPEGVHKFAQTIREDFPEVELIIVDCDREQCPL